MNAVLAIIKKEFLRFFGDARLLLTTILMPGLILYVVYSALGLVFENIASDVPTPTAIVVNMPSVLEEGIERVADVREEELSLNEAKAMIAEGELGLYIVFPENFDDLTAVEGQNAPNVEIYYNSSSPASASGYSAILAILDFHEQSLANVFNVNAGGGQYDLAPSGSASGMVLSMVVPMVLIMLLLSGCVAVVLESIAGEKERGTIATLLVTPVRRSYLAVGKILSLSVIGILSGLSSFLGLIFSLPNLLGGSGVEFDLSVYGPADYISLFAVVLSTVLVLVSLLAIISAYARSTKEANGLIAPVMILAVICSVVSMTVSAPPLWLFFIPVLNSVLCISAVMAGALAVGPVIAAVCVNLVCAALLAVALGAMFNSERIMFNKA